MNTSAFGSAAPPGQALAIQASDGWNIPNSIDADPSPQAIALAKAAPSYRLLIASVTSLGPPSGRYNCHGLVFGSRRVNIDSPDLPVDIAHLLTRDRYGPVRRGAPQVGDVVVYKGPAQIEHTGFVSRLEPLAGISTAPVVIVWSMWGGLGEFEHRVTASPYADCNVEYWRLGQ